MQRWEGLGRALPHPNAGAFPVKWSEAGALERIEEAVCWTSWWEGRKPKVNLSEVSVPLASVWMPKQHLGSCRSVSSQTADATPRSPLWIHPAHVPHLFYTKSTKYTHTPTQVISLLFKSNHAPTVRRCMKKHRTEQHRACSEAKQQLLPDQRKCSFITVNIFLHLYLKAESQVFESVDSCWLFVHARCEANVSLPGEAIPKYLNWNNYANN